MSLRIEKLNSLLKRLAAEFFVKELPFDSVLVTITRADISKDLKRAVIFISVFPDKKEEEVLKAVKAKMSDLKKYLAARLTMKFLPVFRVEIDMSEKARARFEELLKKSNN